MSKNGIRSMVISVGIGLIFWASVSKPITEFVTWLISLV
ncbi:Uncharacterised protein [Raoultella terrigena]|uniref:Uncharacterized protein n=1 Tax=Raoultella terrigena TaxID=577 RepID=A0A3P8M4I3_RAOTE|nr:Uncharacterised protein [Raoultella terrigena]